MRRIGKQKRKVRNANEKINARLAAMLLAEHECVDDR